MDLIQEYLHTRTTTEELCKPLSIEDYVIQGMDDVSPPKWHLAHTTWFFETFILIPHFPGYQLFNSLFHQLFNSYYQSLGNPFPRTKRGLLSRPTVEIVGDYRKYVDEHIIILLKQLSGEKKEKLHKIMMLGLHHEQQHQELLLMDIKYNYSMHPDFPAYQDRKHAMHLSHLPLMKFTSSAGGIVSIGHEGHAFCFDNELPTHQYLLKPYSLANRLVNNAEFREFIEAGGYQHAEFWLADGWDYIQTHHLKCPLYWYLIDKEWFIFTLSGLHLLNPAEPVVHVSYYEADAYARWRGCRLPLEGEWENIAKNHSASIKHGNFLEAKLLQPTPLTDTNDNAPAQLYGDVWEWTMSPYCPYPGYKAGTGALGEYNGKFMNNQVVLKGGCCITPRSHIRPSYRNFYQPDKRWPFSGIRLAKDD